MNRRDLLRSAAGLATGGAVGLAGCTDLFTTRSAYAPPLVNDRPDAVYIPSHTEAMKMVGLSGGGSVTDNHTGINHISTGTNHISTGTNHISTGTNHSPEGTNATTTTSGTRTAASGTQTAKSGRLKCALTYSYPHRFWTVTGTQRKKVSIKQDDTTHLMVSVWDAGTGVYVADAGPTVRVSKGGDEEFTDTPWTMLSQNMGFHAGDNVALSGKGTYTATVTVPAVTTRRLRDFAGAFGTRRTFEFTFKYSKDKRDEIHFEKLPNRKGTKGALDPMKMKRLPLAQAPTKADLPGRKLGQTTSGDAVFIVTAITDAAQFGAKGKTYLAVSARTPYNRYIVPAMSLSGTLTRKGKTVFDGALTAGLDPELHYHYGAMVDGVESGDTLELDIEAPPQVARHEGYETAFLQMPSKKLTV